jgi:hypothetical protein
MERISFSIPFTFTIHLEGDRIKVTIGKTETTASLKPFRLSQERVALEKGKTLFDVVLKAARTAVERSGTERFRAADLYHIALEEYPGLKRNTFNGHVIASAPDHPSHRHFSSKRDYFSYSGDGLYRLSPKYNVVDNS